MPFQTPLANGVNCLMMPDPGALGVPVDDGSRNSLSSDASATSSDNEAGDQLPPGLTAAEGAAARLTALLSIKAQQVEVQQVDWPMADGEVCCAQPLVQRRVVLCCVVFFFCCVCCVVLCCVVLCCVVLCCVVLCCVVLCCVVLCCVVLCCVVLCCVVLCCVVLCCVVLCCVVLCCVVLCCAR